MTRLELPEPPHLVAPTIAVRDSWIAAEEAYCQEGLADPADLVERALTDFEGLVADRQGTKVMWGVPTTLLWYVAGPIYVGELVIRD
jgi:hypothetical protein